MPERKVVDIMIRDLTALTQDISLREAARLFSMLHVTGLPVVDEGLHVIGFLSESDVIDVISPRSHDHSGIFFIDFSTVLRRMQHATNAVVRDYMTRHPITTESSMSVGRVAETMLTEGIKVLPVVRDGVFIGSVNRADVCSTLMEDSKEL